MKNMRFWLACLAAFVVAQALGFITHVVMLGDKYAGLVPPFRSKADMDEMTWVFMVTGTIFTVLFVYIFTKGYENKGVGEGMRFGALVGILYNLPYAYDSFVIYPLPYSVISVWFVSGLITCIAMGATIALIYKPEN